MTIKLSPEVEKDLVMRLAEGLPQTTPEYNSLYASDFNWANKHLEILPEDARLKVDRYLGDRGFPTFLCSELSKIYPSISPSKGQALGAFPAGSNPIQISRDLVSAFRQLPLRYRATAMLPATFTDHVIEAVSGPISLTKEIVIAPGHKFPGKFPVHSEDKSLDKDLFHDMFGADEEVVDRELSARSLYFSMPVLGYATQHSSSVLGRDFEDSLRAFYGASMAAGLLSYGWHKTTKSHPYVMVHSEPDRSIVATERLEEDLLSRHYLLSTENFSERNASDLQSKLRDLFKRVGTIFHDNVDCKRLFTACIWYYRAAMNQRPLDSLLEATIAIEVMLGDRKAAEGVGLANLLGGRCAFLLGRSSKQRESILSTFRDVYTLRSNIVHEGRHALKTGDRKIVNAAKSMCAAIISRELSIRALPQDN